MPIPVCPVSLPLLLSALLTGLVDHLPTAGVAITALAPPLATLAPQPGDDVLNSVGEITLSALAALILLHLASLANEVLSLWLAELPGAA